MLITLQCRPAFAKAGFTIRPDNRLRPVPQHVYSPQQPGGRVAINLLAVKELSLDYAGGHIRMLNSDRLIVDEGPEETEKLGAKFEDAMYTLASISPDWRTKLQRLLYVYLSVGKPERVTFAFRNCVAFTLPPKLATELVTRHNQACVACEMEGKKRYARGMQIINGLPAFQ